MRCVKTVLFPRLTRDRIKTDPYLIDKVRPFAAPHQVRGQEDFDTPSLSFKARISRIYTDKFIFFPCFP